MKGEVRPGYKQTEVGVIPEDWEVVRLGQLVLSVEYGSSAKSSVKGDIPVLRMGNLQDGKIHWGDLVYTNDKFEIERYTLDPGDVLFNRTNTIDLVGKTSIYRGEYTAIFAGYLIRIKVDQSRLDPEYLNLVLNAEFSRRHSVKVLSVAVGQANINGQKVRTYPIPIPPTLAEQQAIAEALSDVDALIDALEGLIAKKRAIKQGAMQELLTGRRRLPGFDGEWENGKLGRFGQFRGGNGFPTRHQGDLDGDFPFFKVSDMNNQGNSTFMVNSNNWISEDTRKQIGANTFPANTIVFAKIGAAVFLERKKILSQESCIDNNMMGFVLDPATTDHRFFHYLLQITQLGKLVAATALPSLNGRDIAELEYGIPAVVEQTAIAAILSDMDAEIAALERRRDKTKLLKQGMMQELLTGRTRLV